MADAGKLVKMEVDYGDTVDKRLPECQEMAKVCQGSFIARECSTIGLGHVGG